MAAVSLQLTTLRAVANNALDYRPVLVSSCSRGTASCALVGPSCSVSSSRWSGWGDGRNSRRTTARAVMEEAVVAEEAETVVPLESLSMYFKVDFISVLVVRSCSVGMYGKGVCTSKIGPIPLLLL